MKLCTKFFACVIGVSLVGLGITPVEAESTEDWPMFGHDPQHTWYTNDLGPSKSDLNWSRGGVFRSPPAVVSGKVYISDDTNVICLDASTGENIWTHETEWAIESSPAVVGGKVYIGSVDKNLYALNASTGEKLWSFEADGWVNSPPTVANGRVYFITHVNTLYALDASTGQKLWSRQDSTFRFPPSVSGGVAYVGTADNRILALDASTGTEIWSQPTEGYVVSAPAVSAGKLYFSTNILDGQTITGARIYSLDASSGQELWKKSMDDGLGSSPAIGENMLYVGSYDGNLYSLNPSNGNQIWSYEAGAPVMFSPVTAGTRVYFASVKTIYSLDASTGDLIWKDYYDTISSPVVVGGNMYIITSSYIYAIGYGETPSGTEGPSLWERPETQWILGAAMLGIVVAVLYWLFKRGEHAEKEEPRW